MKFRKYSKKEYREAFQQVSGLDDIFKKYAKNYNVNIAKAIYDRDFPMTRLEIICVLKNITGNWPINSLVTACRPEDDSYVVDYRRAEIAEYRSIYG